MTLVEFIICAFASFRLTRLIIDDTITEPLRRPFFKEEIIDGEVYEVPKGFIGTLLSCHWCMMIWTSVLMVLFLFVPYLQCVVYFLAVATFGSLMYVIFDKLTADN